MRTRHHPLLVTAVVIPVLAATATAQWSRSASSNLALADGAWEQVQAKIRHTPSGQAYVSWLDSDPNGSPAFGYDVRLQRLDPAGRELWPHLGSRLADRGFSSTQDYGLAVDTEGNALVVFRDDRPGGVQITATKVDPAGNQPWGTPGRQLTSTSAFVASPRIAGTSDGAAVVAWTEGSLVRLQRLDAGGNPLWSPPIDILPPSGGGASLSDLQASDSGGVIVSWIRQSGNFLSPRHLYAQKIDASGNFLWPPTGVAVFDGGSLQTGNFPSFVPDGSGGGVFGWYGVSPLQSYAQHVLADGTEAFGHNGSVASTDTTRVRVSPSVSYRAATGETFLFWKEQNSGQSLAGVYGQKFDASGIRQWTDQGQVLEAVAAGTVAQIRNVAVGDGAVVMWLRAPSFGSDQIFSQRVDGNGTSLHGTVTLCSVPSSKDDFDASPGPFGDVQLVWHDGRSGGNDVFGQNVRLDGGLGPAAGVLFRNAGSNPVSYSATDPILGATLTCTIDLTSTGHTHAALLGYLEAAVIPFGSNVILVDILQRTEILQLPLRPGPSAVFAIPLPPTPFLAGIKVCTQAIHIGGQPLLALSNAQDLYLGF